MFSPYEILISTGELFSHVCALLKQHMGETLHLLIVGASSLVCSVNINEDDVFLAKTTTKKIPKILRF